MVRLAGHRPGERPPALRLDDRATPLSYRVHLELDPNRDEFEGTVDIAIHIQRPVDHLWLNATEIWDARATIHAGEHTLPLETLAVDRDDLIGFAADQLLPAGPATLHIEYRGRVSDKDYSGIFRQKEGDDWYIFTQFESLGARRAFPSFDEPRFKVPFAVTLRVPDGAVAVGNTPEAAVVPGDDDGMKTVRFQPTKPLPSYLVAFAVGPFDIVPIGTAGRQSTEMRVLTPRGQGDRIGYAAEVTGPILERLEDYFDMPYPYEKLDSIAVPHFLGAMENPGLITYASSMLLQKPGEDTPESQRRYANVAAHELAHQWFGNLVTLAWWNDLWLNESFATFASVLCQAEATEYTQAWTTFANVEKSWAYRQDQLPSTHPVAADIPDLHAVEVNFDGITYAKGASVLKQLVAYVGLEAFLGGLRDYFRQHAFGNATFGDLLGALEKSSGRDLSDWGRQWLKTTGLNTLRPDFDVDADGKFTRFAIDQGGAKPGAGETRVHRLAVGIYDENESGKLVRMHREELDVDGAMTEVPALQGFPRGKLILVNDDDLTYCSLRLDPESLQTVLTRVADIVDPLPRTLAWSAAWEMTRDAELRARDFVALVMNGLHAESEVGVAQRLVLQAQTALGSYAEAGWAAQYGWPALGDALLDLAQESAPGSDHQLAFVNALCTSVLAPNHVAVLSTLLDNEPAAVNMAGLVIDTDLRWRIVTALAASGNLDADSEATPLIDAEADNDRTAAGRRHAAAAAAARPQASVKESAWQKVVEDDTLANITARSIIGGFVRPGQGELLAPFRNRYFDAIRGVWDRRSSEVAQTVIIGLYPSWDISQGALDAADEFLADPELAPALRRLVLEGRAGVERALRARQFDAG